MLHIIVFLILNLISLPSRAESSICQPDLLEEENIDGSRVKILDYSCGQDSPPSKVFFKEGCGDAWREMFEIQPPDSDYHALGPSLKDIDKDGYYDIEVITSCGNVNCWAEIYLLDKNKKSYYHFYSGSSDIRIEQGYLISSGRSSCCSWQYSFYKIPLDKTVIDQSKEEFVIIVDAPHQNETNLKGARCRFMKPLNDEYVRINPVKKSFLKYCQEYGKEYHLEK